MLIGMDQSYSRTPRGLYHLGSLQPDQESQIPSPVCQIHFTRVLGLGAVSESIDSIQYPH